MEKSLSLLLLLVLYFASYASHLDAQTAREEKDKTTDHLEFSHPLITESISPDTKLRLTFLNTRTDSGMMSQVYDIELEFAPVPSFSIHLDVPYTVLNHSTGNLDEIELDLKFANFAFAKHQVLLGYGISFGLPTGNQSKGIGSDHIWNVNPFFNGGIMWKKWEWTAFLTFGIPSNQHANEDMQTNLETRVTALYHLGRKWEGLIEAGNATQISRFYKGENNYDITEGLKFKPDPGKPWIIAIGFREPFLKNDEMKWQCILSIFYHFKD